jgi:hypothetical protein
MSVGGTIGGRRGGEARKKQMAEEHGGDVHEAYSQMGQTGAKKGERCWGRLQHSARQAYALFRNC